MPIIPISPLQRLCILCNGAVIQENKDFGYFIHLQRNSHDAAVSKYFYFCSSKWVARIIIQKKKVIVRKFKVISMCSFIHPCICGHLSKSSNVQQHTAGWFLKVGLDLLLLPYFTSLKHIIILSSAINLKWSSDYKNIQSWTNRRESYSWLLP